ncbi:MAG: hypothetical protein IKB73_05015 [Ruminococcus sp.]|nr:hypothetical protein [Ruminococcus sp.]
MTKRILSFILTVVMLMSVVAVSATAVSVDADYGQYSGNMLYFDAKSSGWNNYKKVFCHIWVYGGDAFYPWQAKKEACTDIDGDGIWEYDLDSKAIVLEPGTLYSCIFSNENGMQTYNLLFDSTVMGDTAYCDKYQLYENPEDPSKTAIATFWRGQNPATFGPEKCITSIGNVVGTCIPYTTSVQAMFVRFLTDYLENARTYSHKTDQQILDDAAKELGLKRENVEDAIYTARVSVAWSYNKSTLEKDYTDRVPSIPEKPAPTTIPYPKKAENVDGGIKVTWSPMSGISGYYVYRKTASTSWSRIATVYVGTTSYTDKSVSSGTTYTYTVRAYSGSLLSDYSKSGVSVKCLKTPALSSATNTDGGVKVAWSKSSGAYGYYVYRKTASTSWKKIADLGSGDLSYVDKSASSGTTYYYTVRAYSGSTMSSYKSAGVSVKYLKTPSLSAISNTTNGVKVSWSKTSGASGYYLYRKNGTASWKKIATLGSGTLSYTDKSASKGITYYYTVRAYSGSTMSSYKSKGISIKYLITPTLSTPSNTTSGVKFTWNKSLGSGGYYVYRKTASTSWKKIATVKNTTFSYTDKSASSGTTYTYTVRAYSGSSMSAFKSSAAIKYLKSPTISSAQSSKLGITVKWSKTTGASGYYVYRKTASTSWKKIATTSNLSYVDKTSKKGTTYTYTIRAYSGKTMSSYLSGKSCKDSH